MASVTALAFLGLIVAAAISLAASSLSSQHIGLSSEPLSASKQLSPVEDRATPANPSHQKRTRHRHRGSNKTSTQIAPVTPPPAQAAPPATTKPPAVATPPSQTTGGDDYGKGDSGGRDDSSGRHRGGDD